MSTNIWHAYSTNDDHNVNDWPWVWPLCYKYIFRALLPPAAECFTNTCIFALLFYQIVTCARPWLLWFWYNFVLGIRGKLNYPSKRRWLLPDLQSYHQVSWLRWMRIVVLHSDIACLYILHIFQVAFLVMCFKTASIEQVQRGFRSA